MAAQQVTVQKQLAQAMRKAETQQKSHMQDVSAMRNATNEVMEQSSAPLERSEALNGSESALAASGHSLLQQINQIYEQTGTTEGGVASKRMKMLFKVFDKASDDEIAATFDAKKQGIEAKTEKGTSNPQYVRLQETKRLYRAWLRGGVKAREHLATPEPVLWADRLFLASRIVANINKANKISSLVNAAVATETDEEGNYVPATPEMIAKAQQEALESIEKAEAKRLADREQGKEPDRMAEALVNRIMKDETKGEEWLTKFYNAIPAAIVEWKKAQATAEDVKEASQQANARRRKAA